MIEICNLNKSYSPNQKQSVPIKVLNCINLLIESGEFFCILGPSGCGKSTLLNILAGFIHDYEGSILINNQNIKQSKEKRIMVFQEAALFPWLTVSQNIDLGMKISKSKGKQARENNINKYLNLVGLDNRRDSYVHELSGGMKQRVALARALALEAEILLMDEPFAALDQITKGVMREELVKIWEKENKTIVFVTHDIEEAILIADRIAVMDTNPGSIKEVIEVERARELRTNGNFISEMREKIKEMIKQ